MTTETELQPVEVKITTPILDAIDKSLATLLRKNLNEIEEDTGRAIERGVKTDETARDAEAIVQDGRRAIKVVNEVRLQFTRPIDEGKKSLMREVENLLSPLATSNRKLDSMVMERQAEIRRAETEARREAEEAQRQADAEARAEEERRRKISLTKGGTGEVKPVVAEKIEQPISMAGLRSTTKVKSIVDKDKIDEAVEGGVREIPGVRIYQIWMFEVTDHTKVPEEYRKLSR